MNDDDLPALFQGADQGSRSGQRAYVWLTAARLVLLVLAGVAAGFSIMVAGTDVVAASVAVLFIGAVFLEVQLLRTRPERDWYDGRALAESAKTLAWRYAVGGNPFPHHLDDGAADLLTSRLEEIQRDAPGRHSLAPVTGSQITPRMRQLRSSPLSERRDTYLTGRIQDQQTWYATKAKTNRTRAKAWRAALVTFEVLGVIAALLKAFGVLEVDLFSIAIALTATAAAWLELRQHESLARAYTIAAQELASAYTRLEGVYDENTWATSVSDAEEAISREHTLWRASRSTP